ncbi:MAG: pyridoxal phosphate-dependent aminotransferase [Ardenticatenaceae bacterium]
MNNNNSNFPAFRSVPRTGVIYVMHRARALGFAYDNPEWANLGQGSPETGSLPEAPPRIESLTINPGSHQYSPIAGRDGLRQKVADFYNQIYRRDKASQYTYENVSISSGGRVALTRIVAGLGNINMGHFLPDYTAYEELLSTFRSFIPIPILLSGSDGYKITTDALRREILGRGLNALLTSNPCNPTGQLAEGERLKEWVELARTYRCSLIMDEFYSQYIYTNGGGERPRMVSAAAYVDDVNSDPVILIDGLTKNWRYPGWRISWTVAPKEVINLIASAGSFLDGGANNPFQAHVPQLLDPQRVMQEASAIQATFGRKREYMLARLRAVGIEVDAEPEGTFYVWANLSKLPPPLNDGLHFLEEGLKENVITVPGSFFDVNPGKRRSSARYQTYARISFGPQIETLERGLDAIERVVRKFS